MAITCWIPKCRHNNTSNSCTFFRFPAAQHERERWLRNLAYSRNEYKLGRSARVCSCHFRNRRKKNGPELLNPHNESQEAMETSVAATSTAPDTNNHIDPENVPRVALENDPPVDNHDSYETDCYMQKRRYKCCAKNCITNTVLSEKYVPVFRIPSAAPLRDAWLEIIDKNLIETCADDSVLCARHFRKDQILNAEQYMNAHGEWMHRPNGKVKLMPDSVPSIFFNGATNNQVAQRPARCKRRQKGRMRPGQDEDDLLMVKKVVTLTPREKEGARRREPHIEYDHMLARYLESDLISDFVSFTSGVIEQAIQIRSWTIYLDDTMVVFYMCDFEHIPRITASIKIRSDMTCEICMNDVNEPAQFANASLSNTLVLTHWSQLQEILLTYAKVACSS